MFDCIEESSSLESTCGGDEAILFLLSDSELVWSDVASALDLLGLKGVSLALGSTATLLSCLVEILAGESTLGRRDVLSLLRSNLDLSWSDFAPPVDLIGLNGVSPTSDSSVSAANLFGETGMPATRVFLHALESRTCISRYSDEVNSAS